MKPFANGRKIVGQQLPTLLVVTCCVRLHALLHVVVGFWEYMYCLNFLLGPLKYPGEIKKRLCKILGGKQSVLRYVQMDAKRS